MNPDPISNPASVKPADAQTDATHISEVRQFLAFRMGEQEFGIDVRHVQEVRYYDSVVRIADGPRLIPGVLVSRGVVMPFVDIRMYFTSGKPLYDQLTEVIVLNLFGRASGIVVDSVSDVLSFDSSQIKPFPQMPHTPQIAAVWPADFLIGLGVRDRRRLILMDIEKLISDAKTGWDEKLSA